MGRYVKSRRGPAAGVLGWLPQTSRERGIEITYRWIHEQLKARGDTSP